MNLNVTHPQILHLRPNSTIENGFLASVGQNATSGASGANIGNLAYQKLGYCATHATMRHCVSERIHSAKMTIVAQVARVAPILGFTVTPCLKISFSTDFLFFYSLVPLVPLGKKE